MRTSAWAPSALVYTAVTAVLGRDILAQLGTTIANDPGDPLLTAAILHWNARHIPWTDAWWQFPIYHPTRDALAFSEHLLGLSVIAAPIAWITDDPLATYNLTLLLTFPLCGMAMFALVYYLTRSAAGAFIAGLAYAFAPYRIASLPHIQMLASFWAPVALLGLHRFIDSPGSPAAGGAEGGLANGSRRRSLFGSRPAGRWRWLVLFAAGWALQAAANWYTLVLFSVFVGLWVLWFVVIPRRWHACGMIAAAGVAGALPLAPIAYRYVTVHALHGFERSVGEMRAFSADLAAVLCAPPVLSFWGWIQVFCRAEGELFPGVALFALSVAALIAVLRRDRTSEPQDGRWRVRTLRILRTTLAAVAVLYTMVLLSVVVIGPWRIPLAGISASAIDKPLLIALAAGVLALLMTVVPHAWHRSGSPVSFYLSAAVVMWLLALGPMISLMGEPTGRSGPFALLQALPGVSGLRVPARFWLLTVLSLAVTAGYVTARLVARRGQRAMLAIVGTFAVALLADGWVARIPARPAPSPVPRPSVLPGQVVLHLPVDPYPDIAATWRAVTGGWRSVNGYSGYAPNYYTALSAAARSADATIFAPFQRDGDLHVVVADGEEKLRALTAGQPEAVMTGQANGFSQYRLPRRPPAALPTAAQPIPLTNVRSKCAAETVGRAHDGDARTRWDCLEHPEQHGLVADLGARRHVSAIAYSVGPYGWNVPTELAVETSLDGADWQTASSGSVLGALIAGGLADPAELRAVVSFAAHDARYVRVRPVNQAEDFVWFVSEIEVLGP